MKINLQIAKTTVKFLNLSIICSLLSIPLILIMSQQAKANYGGELCVLLDRNGRELMNLTTEASKFTSQGARDYGNTCLDLVRTYQFQKVIPVSNCRGAAPVDVHIRYSWRSQLYDSEKVGVVLYQSANTQTVQHCTPVGFAGGCSWSERAKEISAERCSLLMSK
jgi:hypothetical protein